MADGDREIRIAERDGDIVRLVGRGPRGAIEVLANMTVEGDRLVLRGLHADGDGPGSLGLAEIRAYARLLGRQMGVSALEIHGGTRTTGARPGKVPRPVVIAVQE